MRSLRTTRRNLALTLLSVSGLFTVLGLTPAVALAAPPVPASAPSSLASAGGQMTSAGSGFTGSSASGERVTAASICAFATGGDYVHHLVNGI